jgi:hypothetical protein
MQRITVTKRAVAAVSKSKRLIPGLFMLSLAGTALAESALEAELRQELEALKERLEQLEARLEASEQNSDRAAKEAVTETDTDTQVAKEDFTIGGALRFIYVWKDFDAATETRRGDIGLDLFRLNVDGQHNNILLSTEYRFYSYMNTIHHGWIGYDFGDAGQAQAGITQVPFGLLPYAAHNFWFGIPYYIGLADDYDAGIKYLRNSGPWNLQLAAFKNAELGNAADLERYSFDPAVVSGNPLAQNEQTNTFNARLAYTLGQETGCSHELGGSAMWGELYNRATDDKGDYWATALHSDSRCGRWNFQFEAGRYEFDPRNAPGVSNETITLGAFAGSHEIAAKANFGVVNVAYNLPVTWPGISSLTCYNDFSVLDKDPDSFENSYINTTGCAIGSGPLFTYVDIIRGRNALFFGNGSLAGGGDDDWNTRFNINVGYYW